MPNRGWWQGGESPDHLRLARSVGGRDAWRRLRCWGDIVSLLLDEEARTTGFSHPNAVLGK